MRLINGAACGNMHHAPVTADHGAVRAGYEPLAPRQTTQEGRNLGLIMTNRPALPSYRPLAERTSELYAELYALPSYMPLAERAPPVYSSQCRSQV